MRKERIMVKIITDSSPLYTKEEANKLGFKAIPLCINIGDWSFRDLEVDIAEFYKKIADGFVPKSSQPPIGEVICAYEENPNDEIINIAMADGLSGTYQSACAAKNMVDNSDNITVFNSRTLCGPHRYLVDIAVKMSKMGKSKKEILCQIEESSSSAGSFLIPQDFSYLKRGGRLTPLAATFGGLFNLKPIMKQSPDGNQIEKFAVKRTLSDASAFVLNYLKKISIDEKYIIFISHANVLKDALKVKEAVERVFPKIEVQLFDLSPAFITQGGPACIAIQYIKKQATCS